VACGPVDPRSNGVGAIDVAKKGDDHGSVAPWRLGRIYGGNIHSRTGPATGRDGGSHYDEADLSERLLADHEAKSACKV
jgi:hypothetical protein